MRPCEERVTHCHDSEGLMGDRRQGSESIPSRFRVDPESNPRGLGPTLTPSIRTWAARWENSSIRVGPSGPESPVAATAAGDALFGEARPPIQVAQAYPSPTARLGASTGAGQQGPEHGPDPSPPQVRLRASPGVACIRGPPSSSESPAAEGGGRGWRSRGAWAEGSWTVRLGRAVSLPPSEPGPKDHGEASRDGHAAGLRDLNHGQPCMRSRTRIRVLDSSESAQGLGSGQHLLTPTAVPGGKAGANE